jgi:uncharacterized damage-inducible protein DinB
MPSHEERISGVREAYRAAHDRLVARLRQASDADVHRRPADGGWSAAQIGWHVAAVDGSFAAVLSGEVAAAKPLSEGEAKPWAEIVASMPQRIEAGRRVQPPPDARRDDVLAALTASAAKLDAALAALSEERGSGYAITHPVLGTVALDQIGDWATAHVIRHNAQAKRALAEASASAQ